MPLPGRGQRPRFLVFIQEDMHDMRKKFAVMLLLLLLLLLVLPVLALAMESGQVGKVSDGDTLHVGKARVRLYGIDCPEKGQPFGQEATEFTTRKIVQAGGLVFLEVLYTDQYGRKVAKVHLGKPDGPLLNQELVQAGLAWVYGRYCTEPMCSVWMGYESTAKASKIGLWSVQNPVAPWNWRRTH